MSKTIKKMNNKKSIFIGGIWHETNTFSSKKTYIKDFKSYQWLEGKNLLKKSINTNTEIGGFLEVFHKKNINIKPSLFAAAVPSGIVSKTSFLKIVDKILFYINDKNLNGIALALHGAMVVEEIDFPEYYLVQKIKRKLKKYVPIVATFDLHANLSKKLFEICDILVGYDTFPHVDMGERGREAASNLIQLIETRKKFKKFYRKLPILTVPQMQATNEKPMKNIMEEVFKSEKKKSINLISISPGFPYSDIKDLGMTIIGYGTNQKELNQECNRLIRVINQNKQNFLPKYLSIKELEKKLAIFDKLKKPIIIADSSDNVGGGSLGANLEILEVLIKQNLPGTILIWAPFIKDKKYKDTVLNESIAISLEKNKSHRVAIKGKIIFQKQNFSYVRDGFYMTGQHVNMGDVKVIKTKFNLKIILTENRIMPFDDRHIKVLGIDPKKEKIIVTKSGSAWKIAFGKIANTIINVDTGDICSSNLERFNYTKTNAKKYWPLND